MKRYKKLKKKDVAKLLGLPLLVVSYNLVRLVNEKFEWEERGRRASTGISTLTNAT